MWCIRTSLNSATCIIMQFPISGNVACALGYRKKTFWLLKVYCAIGKQFPDLFIVRILIANRCTRCTESVKGSHRMGGRQNQIFAPLPFIRTFRMIPLSAKSILLDSNLNSMSPPLHYIGNLLFLSLCIILLMRGKLIEDMQLKIDLANISFMIYFPISIKVASTPFS